MVSHIISFIPPSFKSQLSVIILINPGGLSVSDLDVHDKKPTVIKILIQNVNLLSVPTVTTHLESMLLEKENVQN